MTSKDLLDCFARAGVAELRRDADIGLRRAARLKTLRDTLSADPALLRALVREVNKK